VLAKGTVHVRVVGEASTSPSPSRAATLNEWVVWAREVRLTDEDPQERSIPSRKHAKVESGSLEEYPNVARVLATKLPSTGPFVTAVCGGTAKGVTAFEGTLSGPVPMRFMASTVNV